MEWATEKKMHLVDTLQKNALDCGGFRANLRRFLTSTECFAGFFKTPAYTNPTN
jgi:hypothetical protein